MSKPTSADQVARRESERGCAHDVDPAERNAQEAKPASGSGRSKSFDPEVLDLSDAVAVREVLDLWNQVFGGTWRTPEWFGWKHRDNPMGPSIITLARETASGTVVAARALWRFDLCCGAETIRAYQPCDTATGRQFRHFGLFTKLTHMAIGEARKEAEFLFNFPNAQSKPGYLKLGWKDIGGLVTLARFTRPLRVGMAGITRRGKLGRFTYELDRPPRSQEASPDWAAFFAREGPEEDLLRAKRDPETFRWRYLRHPSNRYELFIEGDAGLVGHPGRRGDLREFRVLALLGSARSDPGRLRDCIGAVEEAVKPDLVSVLLHRCHPAYQGLRRSAFFPAPSRTNLVARALTARETGFRWGIEGTETDTG